MKSAFLLKYKLRFWPKFYTALTFSNNNHGLQKKTLHRKKIFFAVDYIKIIELHIVHKWRHMQSEHMKLVM